MPVQVLPSVSVSRVTLSRHFGNGNICVSSAKNVKLTTKSVGAGGEVRWLGE